MAERCFTMEQRFLVAPLRFYSAGSQNRRAATIEVFQSMKITVSILAEIPEELHESLKGYLEDHPAWDQDRVFSAALSLFLLQNGDTDRRTSKAYLDALFNYAA